MARGAQPSPHLCGRGSVVSDLGALLCNSKSGNRAPNFDPDAWHRINMNDMSILTI